MRTVHNCGLHNARPSLEDVAPCVLSFAVAADICAAIKAGHTHSPGP